MSQNSSVISFGILNKKMLFPLCMGTSSFLQIICYTLLKNLSYEKEGTQRYFYGKPFIIAWFMCLSEVSLGIFYYIEKKNVYNYSLPHAEVQIREITKREVIRKGGDYLIYFYSFITCILDCLSIICLCMVRELERTFYEVDYKALLIVCSTIISIMIFRYKFHFHHLTGGVIIAIGIVAYTLCDLLIPKEPMNYLKDKPYKKLTFTVNISAVLMLFLLPILTGFQENIEKYMMEKMFVSRYKIVFLEGITGFLLISLSFIPLAFINCPENSLLCQKDSSSAEVIENVYESLSFAWRHPQFLSMLILICVSFALFNFFRIQTNYHFSPSHRAIADIMGYFLFFILQMFIPFLSYREKNSIAFNIIAIVCYVIVFVGVLVVLEVIIIYWRNIDKDTRGSIEIRQELEKQIIKSEKVEFDLTQSIDQEALNAMNL